MRNGTRGGFTIVELLMVIGIISVLIGITVSAISGSLRRGRQQRANTLCTMVEQGVATYYAQNDDGKWPIDGLEDQQPNASESGSKNVTSAEKVAYLLTDSEVQKVMLELVQQTIKGTPVMDVSGLYVSSKSSPNTGMDFVNAVRGTRKKPEGIRVSDMVFGYPDADTGKLKRFKMTYTPSTDSFKVML